MPPTYDEVRERLSRQPLPTSLSMTSHSYLPLPPALNAKYPFAALPEPDGSGWSIVFPDIPGVVGFAANWHEIGTEAQAILAEWLTGEDEDEHPLPGPTPDWDPIRRQPSDFALPALSSAEDVAEELGISKRRVLALAKSRDVGQRVGNALVFTESDIDQLRERQPGRPRRHSVPAAH